MKFLIILLFATNIAFAQSNIYNPNMYQQPNMYNPNAFIQYQQGFQQGYQQGLQQSQYDWNKPSIPKPLETPPRPYQDNSGLAPGCAILGYPAAGLGWCKR